MAALLLVAALRRGKPAPEVGRSGADPNETPEMRRLIVGYARAYDVPVDLVQRVVIGRAGTCPRRETGHITG